jgi:glucan phosphorylase
MTVESPRILEVAMEMALPKDLLDRIAAQFGPEKAKQCAMSTSVGGIGPLLRERVIEQGDAGVDVVGVSLMYESVWSQAWHEWGQINLQRFLVGPVLRKVLKATDYGFDLTFFDGTTSRVSVWEADYGKSKVYFLDAPEIGDMVYPGPKDSPRGTENPSLYSHIHRLKQSWLVGRGALMLAKKMNRAPSIAVLSETPTFFCSPPLGRR